METGDPTSFSQKHDIDLILFSLFFLFEKSKHLELTQYIKKLRS